MNRLSNRIRLSLAAIVVAAFLMMSPSASLGQYVVQYRTPVRAYYPAPVYSYYAAPAVSYYAPRRVHHHQYSYSFYTAPAVAYYPPPVVYAPVYSTSYYQRTVIPRRRVIVNTTYYAPAYFRY